MSLWLIIKISLLALLLFGVGWLAAAYFTFGLAVGYGWGLKNGKW